MALPAYPVMHYPKTSSSLVFLEPALRTMFSIMDDYLNRFNRPGEPDRPYFYNERATLSVFAGGIWRSDPKNLVLEEHIAQKQGPAGTYKGRFDIWFEAAG